MNLKLDNCIFCGEKKLFRMHDFSQAYLVKCSNCSLVFGDKIPSIEELNRHYCNYPRYTELSPITVKRYNELLDIFEKFRKTNNMIDLGCSNGLFLEVAKKRGWNVYGTEFDPNCIEFGKNIGITIYKSDALPDTLFDMEFDIVTSFEVIEHINNPNQELQLIKKLLRQGGATYITTPNFNSFSRFLLQHKWNAIEYPEHLTYYTSKTLNKVLTNHGFEKYSILTTGIALSRLRKSLGKVEPQVLTEKNADELLREKIEKGGLLKSLKEVINFLLNFFKIGDAMKVIYIKR